MEKHRVLIVEDDYLQAYSIKVNLKSLKYDVAGMVDNGEGAIELVDKIEPDLILMDILLAGKMNGFEAAAIIREKSEVPIIFVTGYSPSAMRSKVEGTGGADLLVKPIDSKLLAGILEKHLSK